MDEEILGRAHPSYGRTRQVSYASTPEEVEALGVLKQLRDDLNVLLVDGGQGLIDTEDWRHWRIAFRLASDLCGPLAGPDLDIVDAAVDEPTPDDTPG